ncbi:glycerophosphodiester phosphodiesterase [Bacillus carboniphilus]|uniref:Glycerophosphodiester phosphodiesterase n=1 Tax=Bacillus carboniphilus TaxID=86663 RepID=A0ABY9K1S6_9BACI|nr:glycerophosphodiester phosphodiesterase [Bacillus carboniphilus]WLR43876.1 glycerophosphodiester phosphodiesterase [Bacillus carboniphilus]
MTQILAHRGEAAYFPENTMLAFKEGLKSGADGIELDVQLTKDGEVVVIHDERLERTTNGTGLVKDHSYSEIQRLDASYKFKDLNQKVGIPLLKEVLHLFQSYPDKLLNIELKNGIIDYKGIEEKVIKLVRLYQLEEQVVISSFNHYSLAECNQINPEIETAILYYENLYKPWDYVEKIGAKSIHPYQLSIRSAILEKCLQRNIPVRPFTINDEVTMKKMFKWNVSSIITDDPKKAIKIRKLEK